MSNPYVARGPVHSADMFFGREHELAEIAAFLKGNQSISIVGPRKIGKTSLLFHLIRPTTMEQLGLGDKFILAYLDCETLGEANHEEVFGQFASETAAALDEHGLPVDPTLEAAIQAPGRMPFERALRKLNQSGYRLVFLLDEFERLGTNSKLDVNFFNALRSAAGRYQLAFITASASPLIQLTYSERAQDILSSPFFNIFAPLFLGLFSKEDAIHLISEPSKINVSPIPTRLVDEIYSLAGGHPLALQVACFHTLEQIAQQPGEPDFKEIERKTLQELSAHFEYYWRNLSISEQRTLQQLNDAMSRAPADTTLRGILRDLVQKCLLVVENMAYHYPSQAWASFVHSQQMETPSPSQAGGVLTGTIFGPYQVLEPLGKGGMAEVYKGIHTRLNRTVAIKVLPASLASEVDFRERFEREARGVAALRHPHIVQIFDFGDIQGTYYMVMEYISGKDLGQLMKDTGPMSLDQARPILQDLASALDYAHSQGLVHRDVKPSNILLQPTSVPVMGEAAASQPPLRAILTDFGIAKMLGGDTAATRTGLMMGTLNYMAPEQIRSAGEVDSRADIYAVGVLIFQMLTGRLPFLAENPGAMMLAHMQLLPPDPQTINPEISAATALAILTALEKEPENRFPTTGAFIEALG